MAKLTTTQSEMVRKLATAWRSGQTETLAIGAYSMLLKIKKETSGGERVAEFLEEVLTNLRKRGTSVYQYKNEQGFANFLHERIVRLEKEVKASNEAFIEHVHAHPSWYQERDTHCWRCKDNLMSTSDPVCPKYKWLKCHCGACGCNRPRPRGDVFGGTGV